MSRNDINQHFDKLHAALDSHPSDNQQLRRTLGELQQRLDHPEPLDAAQWLGSLRDWEARLAAEHPLVAHLLADLARKLESMGI